MEETFQPVQSPHFATEKNKLREVMRLDQDNPACLGLFCLALVLFACLLFAEGEKGKKKKRLK